jgi:hypothetical protein
MCLLTNCSAATLLLSNARTIPIWSQAAGCCAGERGGADALPQPRPPPGPGARHALAAGQQHLVRIVSVCATSGMCLRFDHHGMERFSARCICSRRRVRMDICHPSNLMPSKQPGGTHGTRKASWVCALCMRTMTQRRCRAGALTMSCGSPTGRRIAHAASALCCRCLI